MLGWSLTLVTIVDTRPTTGRVWCVHTAAPCVSGSTAIELQSNTCLSCYMRLTLDPHGPLHKAPLFLALLDAPTCGHIDTGYRYVVSAALVQVRRAGHLASAADAARDVDVCMLPPPYCPNVRNNRFVSLFIFCSGTSGMRRFDRKRKKAGIWLVL